MGVKHVVKFDRSKELADAMRELDERSIEIGVFEGEHAWLAHIHEFGCVIQVTPKMRAYLHHTGLHLKESTTVIVIPERSFLRGGYDEKKDEVMKQQDMLLNAVVSGALDAQSFLDAVGTVFEGKIKEYAVDLGDPGLRPYTIAHRKNGGSNPLVDSGDMIGSISHRIR